MDTKVPYMNSPCSNCPFRKDSNGIKFLGKKRAQEISKHNITDGFVCHKTVDYSKQDGEEDSTRKQCAGALIIAKKTKTPQPFLNLYQDLFRVDMKLNNEDLIVDSYEEFINIQS